MTKFYKYYLLKMTWFPIQEMVIVYLSHLDNFLFKLVGNMSLPYLTIVLSN